MKELIVEFSIIIGIVLIFLLSCSNTNQNNDLNTDLSYSGKYIKFNQSIEDTLAKYLLGISDTCDIIVNADRSYIHKTLRLNVMPTEKYSTKGSNLLFTKVNGRNLYICTGIENILDSHNIGEIINCSDEYFVIYDSSGVISVINNLNDFDDDLRPSQQLYLKQDAKNY